MIKSLSGLYAIIPVLVSSDTAETIKSNLQPVTV